MRILTCLYVDHNYWLLALAVLVCGGGSWVALELFRRARQRSERQRFGWLFLAAVAAGCAVWCMHFVAMLAYRNDVPATFDPFLTVASLMVAIAGAAVSFALLVNRRPLPRLSTMVLAGLLLGGAVCAMHYIGMFAYKVDGLLIWNPRYVAVSILFAGLFAVAAMLSEGRGRSLIALLSLTLCILSLHFTGMAALEVIPSGQQFAGNPGAVGLAVAVACGVLLIVGTGAASHMIDADVNEKALETLRELALTDSLTGLPNRNSLVSFLEIKLARAQAETRRFAVVIIDFDKFKAVNDVHGHEGGDDMLREVASRMRCALKDGEFLARIGGDEFAAVFPLPQGRSAESFLGRLEAVLARPVQIKEFDVLPHASFGVALYPQDGETAARLLGNADLAMYRAKADPGRGVSYYEASMDEAARRRRELVLELRRAVDRGEFELHYQPQARLRSNAVVSGEGTQLPEAFDGHCVIGYEALLRWRHPLRGNIPPAEFIPLAEESGLILRIGEWVLRTACREAATWPARRRVAVNVSAVQITHSDLPRLVEAVLDETLLDPARLELEITETTFIEDKERCLAALIGIRALGVTIAMDDFGTGYSSLATLRAFPFHRIKLDRSFMQDVTSSPEARAILRAVLALGRSLDIRVLAEGVETVEQLTLLRSEGCTEVQGFLFGRPARAVES
jgi:diguanylate cyclase (GGDEF)-like protein